MRNVDSPWRPQRRRGSLHRRGAVIAAAGAVIALAVTSVFAAGLNVSMGSGFAAGSAAVPPGCDNEVNTEALVTTTPSGGTYPMTGVLISDVDAACDGQLVTVTAMGEGGAPLEVAYGTADSSGLVNAYFLSPLANAALVESFAVVVQASPPQVLSATVTGTAMIGQTLTATGVAVGGPTPTLSYQWQISADGGSTWSDIGGATASTYVVQNGTTEGSDYLDLLRVGITATNSGGSDTAYSDPTTPVDGYAPVNTEATTNGTESVTCAPVTAYYTFDAGPLASVTYQWQRSPDGLGSWADISGATGQSYSPVDADYLQYLRVTATGTNPKGSASATSASTARVVGCAAQVSSDMSMTGSAYVGSAITVSPYVSGLPTPTRTYIWQRSLDGLNWTDIGTEATDTDNTSLSYTPVADDVGYRLRLRVTATNDAPDQQTSTDTGYSAFTVAVSNTPITSVGSLLLDYTPSTGSARPISDSQTNALASISANQPNATTHTTTFTTDGTATTSILWDDAAADIDGEVTATLHDAEGTLVATATFARQWIATYGGGGYYRHTLSFGSRAVGPGYEVRVENNLGRTEAMWTTIYTYPSLP